MKLKELGKNFLPVKKVYRGAKNRIKLSPKTIFLKAEVTQISTHGIWLLARGIEYFLPFQEFPWFEDATVVQIHNVQLLHGFHLRWPDIDVDLDINSFNNLEKYPLVYNYKAR